MMRYLYGVESTVRSHPEANVAKFALQNARRLFLETSEWQLVEDYLLSSYRQNATVLPNVVEMLILRHLDKRDVGAERVAAFVAAMLPSLAGLRKHGEICWLLFLCIMLGLSLKASALAELFDLEDGTIALLVSDAKRLRLIRGVVDQTTWDRCLSPDGLRGGMWLYSYESALKGLNAAGTRTHVTADPYFGPLLSLGVEFLDQVRST
jgi:hypothetical protein